MKELADIHLGAVEIGLILVIVLVVFGPGKLPELGGALGRGIREFRKGTTEKPDSLEQESQSSSLPNQDNRNADVSADKEDRGKSPDMSSK